MNHLLKSAFLLLASTYWSVAAQPQSQALSCGSGLAESIVVATVTASEQGRSTVRALSSTGSRESVDFGEDSNLAEVEAWNVEVRVSHAQRGDSVQTYEVSFIVDNFVVPGACHFQQVRATWRE